MHAGQKGKSKPPFDYKKVKLQEDFADSGVAVHCPTVLQCLHKQDLHRRVSRRKTHLHPHQKIQHQKYSTKHLQRPGAFWKQLLKIHDDDKN